MAARRGTEGGPGADRVYIRIASRAAVEAGRCSGAHAAVYWTQTSRTPDDRNARPFTGQLD